MTILAFINIFYLYFGMLNNMYVDVIDDNNKSITANKIINIVKLIENNELNSAKSLLYTPFTNITFEYAGLNKPDSTLNLYDGD